jgi:hypothetical protein
LISVICCRGCSTKTNAGLSSPMRRQSIGPVAFEPLIQCYTTHGHYCICATNAGWPSHCIGQHGHVFRTNLVRLAIPVMHLAGCHEVRLRKTFGTTVSHCESVGIQTTVLLSSSLMQLDELKLIGDRPRSCQLQVHSIPKLSRHQRHSPVTALRHPGQALSKVGRSGYGQENLRLLA